MNPLIKEITNKFLNNDDFFLQQDYFMNTPVILMGFNTMIDLAESREAFHVYTENAISTSQSADELMSLFGEVKENDLNAIVSSIVQGKLILYFSKYNKFVVSQPIPKLLNRFTEPPTNENVLQGPLSSFVEDIEQNIGIVRKQVSTDQLFVKSFYVGKDEKKKISLLYCENHVQMELVNNIVRQLEMNLDKDVHNLQNLSKTMGFAAWESFSKFKTTELPLEAAQCLRMGKVVLFVDRLPLALILPSLLWDLFAMENDRNYPLPLMVSVRLLRIIGVLMTLIVPALYVALVAVNPEVLRIELALAVSQSRDSVPYPALVEILLILVILELILEASVRLPKSIGPTITMVGGIILGQAIVAAKLVSNLIIIILAATTIANSTVVGFQNSLSIRLFKYLIVVLAAMYGVLGILAGLVLVCAYLASLNTFGVPYIQINVAKDRTNHG
ncbi:spore germination protein [Paenibacillus chondroitinus]|uniref:Spore germination protein n=1 Tax=Paenibacillus chondroitinus TaxID=59842 RepID=A0ABU6DLG0_9BACL|nr:MULTISPECIES: spore germination protein [Paenibacillus]MCY9660665.1 spore germination protein [Paenibacillus anseongense]MEB4798155.1 spore germination protein [Paenibacillus chondroitinus]